jgi:chromosome segregation ATPase
MSEQTEAQRLAELIRRGEWSSTTFNGIDQIRQAADELRRLEAENTRLQASLEECSGNCTALKDQVRRMRSELERPMSSEATVLVHDNARLRSEVQARRGAGPASAAGQLEAGAKRLAELFDYPWEQMTDMGRQLMRKNVISVLAAIAAAPQPAQGEKQ